MRNLRFKFYVAEKLDAAEEISSLEWYPDAARVLKLPLHHTDESAVRVKGLLYVDSGSSDQSMEVLWSGALGPSIDLVDEIGQCVQPVLDTNLNKIVEDGLRLRISRLGWRASIYLGFNGKPPESVEHVAIGVCIEVLRDGTVLETFGGPLLDSSADVRDFEQRNLDAGISRSLSRLLTQNASATELARWKIRLRSDAEAALMGRDAGVPNKRTAAGQRRLADGKRSPVGSPKRHSPWPIFAAEPRCRATRANYRAHSSPPAPSQRTAHPPPSLSATRRTVSPPSPSPPPAGSSR